ncbi:hypothetical protein F5884DRAFT_206626 [Xylogone sp. PMI_703]|nr:hypothetical protein F5884DRAFT_206626 [Xylogone sp. PMI_703]
MSANSSITTSTRPGYCRNGNDCPFVHDPTRLPGSKLGKDETIRDTHVDSEASSQPVPDENGMVQDRRQAVKRPSSTRVVPKPVPKAQIDDPREFQLGQIRRRYSPKETTQSANELWGIEEGTTLLKFNLPPSDPDFPFEISMLECQLSVPPGYPESRPTLKVGNRDIPRGFAVNVERGFDDLAQEKREASLLELVKALDRNLETFLSAQKAETITIVPNKDTRHLSAAPARALNAVTGASSVQDAVEATEKEAKVETKPEEFVEIFTEAQVAEASKRREAETRQLEARMGRLPFYKKSSDGVAYTLPITPARPQDLPIPLRAVKSIQLFVPLLYPLQNVRIKLEGVDQDQARIVEKAFEQKAKEQRYLTLMNHINFLSSKMHVLATTVLEPEITTNLPASLEQPQEGAEDTAVSKETAAESEADPEKPHIHHIPRPLEWVLVNTDGESSAESDDSYTYDSGDESPDGGVEVPPDDKEASSTAPAPANPERGTSLSFPFIELYGIELLEIATLNLTVKCERCKEVTEIKGLKDGVVKNESCRKCATMLSAGFRREFIHSNAVRAGFLDLEQCFVVDMLPSAFIPTCSRCSTAYPAPGIISVRGETTSNVCRECHQRFTFKLPNIKFLRITSSHLPPSAGPRRKKITLGLTPGTELPKRGRCRHYTKSYRWFRFSCCNKVYTCDKCHDESEEHVHEWANRMICGWCSREQNYRPEDCGICHGGLIGKKGTGGFWEGGKGTRDRVKMSRKDPRKYKSHLGDKTKAG